MREPVWIREDVALAVHRRQLAEHGGRDGIRDAGLLQSALNRPKHLYHYGGEAVDMAALAAAYAYGLAQNHPFMDGNKRTAFVICRLFLVLNGMDITASGEEKYDIFITLAAGKLTEPQLADWITRHLQEGN